MLGKEEKLIYPDLSYVITGLCFSVQNELGRYCKEKQYSNLIEKYLVKEKIEFRRESMISGSSNRLDFLIDGRIILEIKAKTMIGKNDYYQLQRYLQSTNAKLGLLINFRDKYLKCKRVIRIDTKNKQRYVN